MPNKAILISIIILVFIISLFGMWLLERNNHKHDTTSYPVKVRRIVSMSPSVTEILFDLGLGNKLVGVTDFCKYPPEAAKIEKIGGYLDTNYEAIIALKPDIVILRKEFQTAKDRLQQLGIRTLAVNHDNIEGIIDSYRIVSKACGIEAIGLEKADQLKKRVQSISDKTKDLPRLKVLICIERELGIGSISGIIAAGKDGFYDEIVHFAGGGCLFQETGLPFPKISAESILRSNPDVIIDMIPDIDKRGFTREQLINDWQVLANVSAVKNGRVHVLTQDYMVIPGPRFIMIIEAFVKLIHPEVEL